MIKLIACDLDETLLNDKKEITKANLAAIQKARKEYGVYFVPATGRGFTCLHNVLEALEAYDQEDEYIISNNGGILVENKDFKILQMHALPFEKAKELFTFGYQKGICVQVFTAQDVFAYHLNEEEAKWLFTFKPDSKVMDLDHIDFLANEPIAKILFESTDMAYLHAIANEMHDLLDGCVEVSYSSNRYLELNAIGVDKGLGLHDLARHLHLSMDETMAIGDNLNDIAMLKEAGVAVAVANACDEIKEVSDYITKANHNEDAIAEAISTYIFKKEGI